jgi:BirA family biotin operon repressor/biotin-[acetyl-CoA-carboxylase] ligase
MEENVATQIIAARLNEFPIVQQVLVFDELDSTNTYGKGIAREGKGDGTLVLALTQTSGRGRLGRTWVSDGTSSLTFSLVLKPRFPVAKSGLLSIAAGIAVADGLHELAGLRPTCKWPNDVLIKGMKVCGILSEILHGDGGEYTVILGIGVNVNQNHFPGELARTATSLIRETSQQWNRDDVLSSIVKHLNKWYDVLNSHNYELVTEAWKWISPMIGTSVVVDQHGIVVRGTVKTLNDDGSLLLSTDGEDISIYAGDVTIQKEPV